MILHLSRKTLLPVSLRLLSVSIIHFLPRHIRLMTHLIGCIWVSAAADFGPEGVLER